MPDRGVSYDVGEDAEPQTRTAVSASSNDKPGNDLAITLGANLRRLRARSGLSLEKLASLSGVSRGMIGRIEMGRSTPTIGLLSQLAEALDVQLVSLIAVREQPAVRVLRQGRSTTVETAGGRFVKRPLSGPPGGSAEFFEITIAPGHVEDGERRAAGATVHAVVASGSVVVAVGDEPPVKLAARDAIVFSADVAHTLHNPADQEAVLYVSISGDTTAA
jgi:transcriptional regulator with XRE-family HTH domain